MRAHRSWMILITITATGHIQKTGKCTNAKCSGYYKTLYHIDGSIYKAGYKACFK